MSTKMIRKIIEAHRALGPDVRRTPAHELHQALDEVEAIERAAVSLARGDRPVDAIVLMQSIAKEAP